MARRRVTVAGAGIIGLWQARTLARRGYDVMLVDRELEPLLYCASRHAGAMLAPWVEAESAPGLVRDLGTEGLGLWRETYPGVVNNGSLVVAVARDQPDLIRFAKLTEAHVTLDRAGLAALEPDLAGRFSTALYFQNEAHVATPQALAFLMESCRDAGVDLHFGRALEESDRETIVIDCRGLGARHQLADLRGVRGERLLVRTADVSFSRPVRLLHPRHPLYVVPWGENRYLVGATMIESEDSGPVTVRSALELLGAAYALHPAFGEAEVLEMSAGVRPAFPDNIPRARVVDGGRSIMVNGAYRHGFLLAPVLARAVADHLESGATHPLLQT
ncbi:MAG: FAD-dependent oxidoreductase [Deltaproteobacteria bacterium]